MKRLAIAGSVMMLILAAGSAYAAPKKESAPPPQMTPAADSPAPLSGKVVETHDAGGYSYVCIEKNGKKTWAAVPQMDVKVGQEITLNPGAEMKNFKSKGLNRTFESIIFTDGASIGAAKAATPKEDSSKAPEMLETGGSAAAVPKMTEKVSVPKATGPDAYTVSEVFQKRAALNKKQAVVKAKVVKVSANIMGKNWLHLQDGTGSAEKGSNDLVATTADEAKVGDIVTVKGTVAKDKDFGYGYKYNVILEEAKIQR